MTQDNIDISESLRAQRTQCVRVRDNADRLAKLWGDSEPGRAMSEHRARIDAAISQLDEALRAYGGK